MNTNFCFMGKVKDIMMFCKCCRRVSRKYINRAKKVKRLEDKEVKNKRALPEYRGCIFVFPDIVHHISIVGKFTKGGI